MPPRNYPTMFRLWLNLIREALAISVYHHYIDGALAISVYHHYIKIYI